MGFPLAPVGAGQFFVPGHQPARDSKNDPSQLPPLLRQSESRDSRDAPHQRSRAAENDAGNGAESSGLYEVSASVVLQQQLFFLATTEGATDTPNGANAVANTTASAAEDSGQAAGSSSNSGVAAPVSNNIAASGAAGTTNATDVTSANSNPATIPSSAMLKQEEAQLQQALQQLGLSPAAIQQFSYESQLLAQLAPGLFQEFLSYVLQLAQAAEPSVPSTNAASVNAAAAQSVAASTPPSSPAPATSQQSIALEFGSAQVTQAELSITPSQNGGETVSLEAQSATVSFASLQAGSSNSSQPSTPTSSSAPPATNSSSRTSSTSA